MKNYIFIIAVIFIFSLLSCKEKWHSTLEKVDQSLLYHNNYQEWELVQVIKNKWDTYYTIQKVDNDTLKIIFFLEGVKDGSIEVNVYKKQYRCNDMDTCFLEMHSQDTLFFYHRSGNGEKRFEVGEYAYRFTHFEMDSIEVNYYLKHADSLNRVRGDNLPKLF